MKHLKIMSMLLLAMGAPIPLAAHIATTAKVQEIESVQQQNACTGIVSDASGQAIIGASVAVKGSNQGTITDVDGKFHIANVKKEPPLRFPTSVTRPSR